MLRLIHPSLFLHHVVLVSSGSLQLSYSHPLSVNLNLQHLSLSLLYTLSTTLITLRAAAIIPL